MHNFFGRNKALIRVVFVASMSCYDLDLHSKAGRAAFDLDDAQPIDLQEVFRGPWPSEIEDALHRVALLQSVDGQFYLASDHKCKARPATVKLVELLASEYAVGTPSVTSALALNPHFVSALSGLQLPDPLLLGAARTDRDGLRHAFELATDVVDIPETMSRHLYSKIVDMASANVVYRALLAQAGFTVAAVAAAIAAKVAGTPDVLHSRVVSGKAEWSHLLLPQTFGWYLKRLLRPDGRCAAEASLSKRLRKVVLAGHCDGLLATALAKAVLYLLAEYLIHRDGGAQGNQEMSMARVAVPMALLLLRDVATVSGEQPLLHLVASIAASGMARSLDREDSGGARGVVNRSVARVVVLMARPLLRDVASVGGEQPLLHLVASIAASGMARSLDREDSGRARGVVNRSVARVVVLMARPLLRDVASVGGEQPLHDLVATISTSGMAHSFDLQCDHYSGPKRDDWLAKTHGQTDPDKDHPFVLLCPNAGIVHFTDITPWDGIFVDRRAIESYARVSGDKAVWDYCGVRHPHQEATCQIYKCVYFVSEDKTLVKCPAASKVGMLKWMKNVQDAPMVTVHLMS